MEKVLFILTLLSLLFCTLAYADNPPETIYDEGTRQGVAYKLNCVGAGITCTQSGITGTLTVNGGGGSASAAGGTGAIQYNSGSSTFAGDETKFSFTGTNVGINTSNPQAALTVKQSGTSDPFHVASSSSTALFKVMNGGNIGISSSSPGQVLDVNGVIRTINAGSIAQPSVTISTNGNGIYAPAANQLGWVTNGTLRATLDSTGNLGLGSSNPGQVIDVVGSGRFLASGTNYFGTNVGIGTAVANGALEIEGGNVGIGTWNTAFAALSIINGNVGIGTWKANGLLNVSGKNGVGFSVKTGANTACNTTCPASSACVFGFDTGLGGSDVVACTDATADTCLCAGP